MRIFLSGEAPAESQKKKTYKFTKTIGGRKSMSVSFVTSLSHEELKSFIKQSIREVLSEERSAGMKENSEDDLMDVEKAAAFLGMAVPTIYEKTSRRIIPHLKQGKKLYFSKRELTVWLKKGKVKTIAEIEDEASNYVLNRKRA